jgi:hypothetical protein
MSDVSTWSTTPGSNNSATPDGWPEGQAASTVNDCARQMMAELAEWYLDTKGSLTTTGSANAYVLTTNTVHATLAAQSLLVFRASFGNTGAATLNVDGLGALALRHFGGNALVSGSIVQDKILVVVYNATAGAYDIIGGTVIDPATISNVPLLTATNTFTGANYFRAARFYDAGATDYMEFSHNGTDMIVSFTNTTELDITATTFDLNGNFDLSGTLTTPNLSASEIGFKGIPQNVQTDHYTLVLADAGKHIIQNGASKTVTIPANASVAFPVGTVVTFVAGDTMTIAITTDTLFLAGTGFATTGSRTLAAGGIATAIKTGSAGWVISGVGLT